MGKLILIGVDSGATKTEAAAIDVTRQECAFADEGPSNPAVVGVRKAAAAIASAVSKALAALSREKLTPHLVAVGAAGVVSRSHADSLRRELAILLNLPLGRVIVFEDVVAAHASVFLLEDGVVGVLGTGSCVYGTHTNRSARAGGWGHLLGDEGSGYRLGLRGLREVLECFDGLKECSDLAALIASNMGFKSTADVLSYVYYSDNPKVVVASIAKMLLDACRSGNRAAVLIVEEEMMEFTKQIAAVIRRMGVPSPRVGFIGSVYKENEDLLRGVLASKLEEVLSTKVEVFEQKIRVPCGAVIAGLKLRGSDDELLTKVLDTVKQCCSQQ